MQLNNVLIEKNVKNILFKFIAQNDSILSIDQEKKIFGKPINDIIDLKSNHYGVDITLLTLEKTTKFLCNKIREHENSNFSIKNNQLICFFYCITEIPSSNLKLLDVYEFRTEPWDVTREEWSEFYDIEPRFCCLKNYVSQGQEKLTSTQDLEQLSPEKLDSCCVFPTRFLNIKAQVWTHLLDSNNNLVKKKFESLKLNIVNPLKNNVFGGFPINFVCLSMSLETIRKKQLLESYSKNDQINIDSLKFNTLFSRYLDSMYLFNPNCKDMLSHLCFQDASLENYIASCLFSIYHHTSLLKSKDNKIEASTKLIFCSFFV